MHYFFRRVLHSLFVLLGVTVLTFLLGSLSPGDFFDEMRLDARVSASAVAAARASHGVDRSLPVKYVRWLTAVLDGNFGVSLTYNSAAAPILRVRARNTLLLTGASTLCAWLIALPVGIWSAAKRNGLADLVVRISVSGLVSIPELILALLFLLLAVRSAWFPAGGIASLDFPDFSFWSKCKDLAWHLFLPSLTLTLAFLPMLVSHVRAAMGDVLSAPFIAAAHAHGIPFGRLMLRHALPAAANPLITLLGFSIGNLLSSSVLVEAVFSWPGLGQLLIQSILERDLVLVVDVTLLGTVLLIAGNLLADMLLYGIDPRIRET
jgi:peptide/nickel transport system permease protein